MLAQRDGELWNSLDKNSLAVTARLQQRINDSIVIIGEIKEVPVGVAVLDLRRPSDHIGDAPIAVIEEIYTMADARGVGVGSAMITTAVEWCRSVGARGIEAIALPGDRNTKNFFKFLNQFRRFEKRHTFQILNNVCFCSCHDFYLFLQ